MDNLSFLTEILGIPVPVESKRIQDYLTGWFANTAHVKITIQLKSK